MTVSVAEVYTLWANPAPLLVSRQAAFAGLAPLGRDEILAMFAVGQAFDAADMRMHVSRSTDRGRTWSDPVPMHDDRSRLESESFKPLRLSDGRLIATGYVFERPDMLTPIVDPETLTLLPMRNRISFSDDGGRRWTVPRVFSVDGAPLELSGPPIQAADGRILAAAAPFHLGKDGHEGWLLQSTDGGESWHRLSVFFRSPGGNIAPWEARLAEIAPGRIAVLFWAHDAASETNLDNHVAVSDDGGQSFGAAIRTGVAAQASNLLALGGNRALTIHCHRAPPVSLTVRKVDTAEGFRILSETPIFAGDAMAVASGNIAAEFGSLKFGQPSLTRLDEAEVLAVWWQVENCQHVIKAARLTMEGD